eukprot:TRINITY_DN21767_c0_g1_i1.p1 TRINITY_DN21767_c0_g1~~TRINITY_DN21767_c0_g1_i1.p1  ORF type:complete len:285 (-),score=45.89 TRINITY_DN21767_c0_g1_i1:158-1012(-)
MDDGRVRSQRFLTESTTERILNLLRPDYVFSGHLHHACTVNHSFTIADKTAVTVETSVGSFNPRLGDGQPSVLLLSVPLKGSAPVAETNHTARPVAVRVCHLPSQQRIHFGYGFLLLLTVAALLLWPANAGDTFAPITLAFKKAWADVLPSGRPKLKDEDAGEMEMIFDAEGMMHLVRKVAPSDATSASGISSSSDRRGTTQTRHAASKMKAAAGVESDGLPLHADGSAEASTSRQAASAKQKGAHAKMIRSLIRRLISTLGLFGMIFAVQLALYVSLVAKDWS